MSKYQALKEKVLRANKDLVSAGLVILTWGNASEIDRENGVVAIKPSGVAYDKMQASDIVITDLDGVVIEGTLNPSSDLMSHLAADYIRVSMGLKERGALLADLIRRDAPLKDLITVVFCSCDYFTKEEIEEFLQEQSKMERSEEWVRTKNKADSYLLHGNYRDAIMNYRMLLTEKESFGITSETLGDIYHNLAIALLHTDGFGEAADYFREAYERNHREETLKQYLLALRFSGDRVMYESALDIYQVTDSVARWLDVAYFQTELETQEISDFNDMNTIRHLLREG